MKKTFLLLCLLLMMVAGFSATAMAADTTYNDGCLVWTLPEGISGSASPFYWTSGNQLQVALAKNSATAYTDYAITRVAYVYQGQAQSDVIASNDAAAVSLNAAGTYVLIPYYQTSGTGAETAGNSLIVYVGSRETGLTSVADSNSGAVTASGSAYQVVTTGSTGTLTVTATDSDAQVAIDSGSAAAGSQTVAYDISSAKQSFTVVVTAENGVDSASYTVTVTKSATPSLSGLRVKGSDSATYLAASGFSAATTSYSLNLANGCTYLYLYPTFDSSYSLAVSAAHATVGSYNSSSGYYRITLNSGYSTDTLTIAVSDAYGNENSYTLALTTAAAIDFDVDMRVLGSDGVTYLSKSEFEPDEDEYDLDVDDDVTYLYLYIYFDDDDYSVKVKNGSSSVSRSGYSSSGGYYYYTLSIDTDDPDTISVKVTETASGDTETYYLYPNSSSGSGSGADELEGLKLSLGTSYSSSRSIDLHPAFDADITDYTVLIPYSGSYSKATLRFALEDEDVELEIAGSAISLSDDQYDYTFSLSAGSYVTVKFSVEDEDYTLKVYFAAKSADDYAYLDDLAVRTKATTSSTYELELDPDFDEDETEYSIDNAANYSKLYLYAEAGDDDMIILVEDELLSGSYWSFDPDDYDEITVTVFAEDLDEYEEYTIDLDGGSSTSLTSLYLSGSAGTITISPSFSSSRTTYVAQVANGVSYAYLTLGGVSSAKVSFNSGSYATYSSSTYYTLNTGLNTFDIVVGSTHYYVNVYRPAAASTIVSSSQYVSVNSGSSQQLAAYNINGNNFVKLRDLAYLLNGSAKQFSVSYTAASKLVSLYSGSAYTAIGGELTIPGAYSKAQVSIQSLNLNGSYVYPMAYNIDGYNYVLLRDMAALLNFQISFSGTTAYLTTTNSYGGQSTTSTSTDTDFEVDMKLIGDDGVTYLSKSDFEPDEEDYEVELDSDVETLTLYVYFDSDDYTVKVKYDGSSISRDGYSTSGGYYYYEIDVDIDDLDDITVTVTNDDSEKMVYTIALDEE